MEGIILNIIPEQVSVHDGSLQQSLEVFPNPASDLLYIKNLPCESVNYSIYNVLGQEVSSGFSCGTISVAELERGFYFLRIKTENFQKTAKIIVK